MNIINREYISRMKQIENNYAQAAADLSEAIIQAAETTKRSGQEIGNALRTILKRTSRPKTLWYLELMGFDVAEKNVMGILKEIADKADRLNQTQKSQLEELMGGIFNVNIVKAVTK